MAILGLFACAILGGGCGVLIVAGAAGAGAGTMSYLKGKLEVTLDADMERSTEAVQDALKELHLRVISEKTDALSAEFLSRTAQDKKVTINLNKVSDEATLLTIRVGTFGDKVLSTQIYDQIKEELEDKSFFGR